MESRVLQTKELWLLPVWFNKGVSFVTQTQMSEGGTHPDFIIITYVSYPGKPQAVV